MSSLFIYCLLSYATGLDVMSLGPIGLLGLFDDACLAAFLKSCSFIAQSGTFSNRILRKSLCFWPRLHPHFLALSFLETIRVVTDFIQWDLFFSNLSLGK
jgi:hypothetical protein